MGLRDGKVVKTAVVIIPRQIATTKIQAARFLRDVEYTQQRAQAGP